VPELPEVEIVARRLDRAIRGAEVESAVAPGMVTMKTWTRRSTRSPVAL